MSVTEARSLAPALELSIPIPSKYPITPSRTARSASFAFRARRPLVVSGSVKKVSRFRLLVPRTFVWNIGSMKSGPHLKEAGFNPFFFRRFSNPQVISVLPLPLEGAAIMIRLILSFS